MDILQDEYIEQEGFSPSTPEEAAWAARRIKGDESRLDMFRRAAIFEIDRLKKAVKAEEEKHYARTAYLRNGLMEFMATVPSGKARTQKSLDLPGVKIVQKYARQDIVRDDDALIEMYRGTEFVKTTESLRWAELKKGLQIVGDTVVHEETGQVLDLAIKDVPARIEVK